MRKLSNGERTIELQKKENDCIRRANRTFNKNESRWNDTKKIHKEPQSKKKSDQTGRLQPWSYNKTHWPTNEKKKRQQKRQTCVPNEYKLNLNMTPRPNCRNQESPSTFGQDQQKKRWNRNAPRQMKKTNWPQRIEKSAQEWNFDENLRRGIRRHKFRAPS